MRVIAKPAFKEPKNNPYTWLLYKKMEGMNVEIDEFSTVKCIISKYDIFHIHWPEWYLGNKKILEAITKTIAILLIITLMRVRGTKIVWTVHNLQAHQKLYSFLESIFWKIFTFQLDGFISLSKTGIYSSREKFPHLAKIPGFVIPHSHYRDAYPNHLSLQEARIKLKISSSTKVLLFFGRIRPYKNIPALVKSFKKILDKNVILYIVGSFSSKFASYNEEVKREISLDSRIKLYEHFVSDKDIQIFFNAANLAIFPFSEILNSGSALLALSFNKPILVPHKGSLIELQQQVGKEWVFTYKDDINHLVIQEALNWESKVTRSDKTPLGIFDSKFMAEKTIEAYQEIHKQ